jgi:phosphohistidine phosphatase SixA
MRIRPHRHSLLLTLLLGALFCPAAAGAQDDPVVVYLVRHAERAEDGTSDPPISEAGHARALLLAEMLRDAGITRVHSTDYERTRSTAAPTADALGLEMLLYDPRDLAGMAAQLRQSPGRHLVLGHSNTTPQLVEALGGSPGSPIEEMEYDRLYIVTLTDGEATTVLLRFGARHGG